MENSLNTSGSGLEPRDSQSVATDASRASEALDVAIDMLEDIQKLVSGGRPRMFRIKFGNKVVAEVPVALTAAAALAAGLAAVVLTKLTVEVEHED